MVTLFIKSHIEEMKWIRMVLEFYMSQVITAIVCFTIDKVPQGGNKMDSNGTRVLFPQVAFVCYTMHKVPHMEHIMDSNGDQFLCVPGNSCICLLHHA